MLSLFTPADDIMAGKEAEPAQQEIRISLFGLYFELVNIQLVLK
jgi:hypothetical protein